ncbi:hypothetical protein EDC94DRAFT_684791 [Helicostylum pulchrum]|nr:hypothetical protein EDC94DRAFT_684791 [Helicostylum pulchrum]
MPIVFITILMKTQERFGYANNLSMPIGITSRYRFFREALAPGEKACCPYDVKSCVKPQTKEDIIFLTFRRTTGIMEYPPVVVNVPGGGWISMKGNDQPYEFTILVYNADGSPFDFEYKVDHQAGYL